MYKLTVKITPAGRKAVYPGPRYLHRAGMRRLDFSIGDYAVGATENRVIP
jgi:hypothetical protein